MPNVYLSPSLEERNPYADGGNEEYYMNLIADAMQPYLASSGISFSRNNPEMPLSQAIADSNRGDYDLHLAIQSAAAQKGAEGKYTGAAVFYYPTSARGKRLAEITQSNYKSIYPIPGDVDIIPSDAFEELNRTKAPAALIEVGYHDNPSEAQWIRENINNIGRNLAKSVADYLGVPFV